MYFFLVYESSWCEMSSWSLDLGQDARQLPSAYRSWGQLVGTNGDLLRPKDWIYLELEMQGEFQQIEMFFWTGMKMETPGSFTWSENAGRGNAFSISRNIFEISAQKNPTYFVCVCYISKSNDTSAKIIQLLRGRKQQKQPPKPKNFLTQGDGWLFLSIKPGCGRELFCRGPLHPWKLLTGLLRAVLWNCRL